MYKQNDVANSFFIIDEGIVEMLINDKQVRVYNKGDIFGMQSSICLNQRTSAIRALVETFIWQIDYSLL